MMDRAETLCTRKDGRAYAGIWVCTSNASDAFTVVAARESHPGNPLDAKVAELLCVARFKVRSEAA